MSELAPFDDQMCNLLLVWFGAFATALGCWIHHQMTVKMLSITRTTVLSLMHHRWCKIGAKAENTSHCLPLVLCYSEVRTLPNGNRITDRLDRVANLPPVANTAFTAGWIKMALGMDVGLGPGHIALHGDPAPLPQKGDRAPNFRPISIVAKRLYVSGYHLARGTQLPQKKRRSSPPTFWPMSIVAKRLDGLRCHLVRR